MELRGRGWTVLMKVGAVESAAHAKLGVISWDILGEWLAGARQIPAQAWAARFDSCGRGFPIQESQGFPRGGGDRCWIAAAVALTPTGTS